MGDYEQNAVNTIIGTGSEVSDNNWEDEPVKEQTSSENEFTLKYLGETMTVDKNQAIELAQKGMDYDRIRRRFEKLKTTAFQESGNPAAVKRATDIDEFLEDYPEVKPEAISIEVWQAVKRGRTLSEAYTKWENSRIKSERETSAQKSAAAGHALGSRRSAAV